MNRTYYSKPFKLAVVMDALKPENDGLEHVIAEKYGIKPNTVRRWRSLYLEYGEMGLTKGNLSWPVKSEREKELEKENAELREEVQILKKASAFLADVMRK